MQAERRTPAKAGVTSSILAIVSCYGYSPSTGTNASTFLAAPSQACVSQQPGTHSCSEFHFRSASSSCARRPASQPAHRNTARCGLSSDAHAGATRRRSGHRHAGAVRRTSVSLAFCCRRTCVRRQHLIVLQTNPATAGVRGYSQTRTKKCANPSLLIRNKPLTFHAAVPPHPQIPKNKQTNPSLLSLLIAHYLNNKQTPHLWPTPPTLAFERRAVRSWVRDSGARAPRHPLPHAARKLRFCVAATTLSRRFYPLNRGIERCYRSFHKQCAKTCASVCCRCGHVPRSVCLCYRLGCPAKMSYPLIFTLSHSPVIRNRSLCLPHLSPTLVVRYCTPAEASPLPPSLSLSRFHLMGIGSSVAGARLALAVRFPYIRCTPPRSPRSRPAT